VRSSCWSAAIPDGVIDTFDTAPFALKPTVRPSETR
jgi:hypothetical protein